jgi:hypothetical protein
MLAETLRDNQTKPGSAFTEGERAKIMDMLNGNDDGGWW